MDFVHDQLATGPKLRILTVVDTFSRFSPAVVPRFSFRTPDVVEVLERMYSEVGYPASIRVDQGSEFTSRSLHLWAYIRGVTLDFGRPGKPTDNAFIEFFNGGPCGVARSEGVIDLGARIVMGGCPRTSASIAQVPRGGRGDRW